MMKFVSWDDEIPNMMGQNKKCSKPPTGLCKALKILGSMLPINSGFLYPNSWMVSNGKSENKMDDLGVPHGLESSISTLAVHAYSTAIGILLGTTTSVLRTSAGPGTVGDPKKSAECVTPSQVTKPCLQTKFHVQ